MPCCALIDKAMWVFDRSYLPKRQCHIPVETILKQLNSCVIKKDEQNHVPSKGHTGNIVLMRESLSLSDGPVGVQQYHENRLGPTPVCTHWIMPITIYLSSKSSNSLFCSTDRLESKWRKTGKKCCPSTVKKQQTQKNEMKRQLHGHNIMCFYCKRVWDNWIVQTK